MPKTKKLKSKSKAVKRKNTKKVKPHIEIARAMIGLCHMAVCCDKTAKPKEILKFCNLHNPAGTSNGWMDVHWHKSEKDKRPVQCEEHKNRIHVLVVC
jgi:hypothetical protein